MSYKVCYYNWKAFVGNPEYRELVCERLEDAIKLLVSETNRLVAKLDDGLQAQTASMRDVELYRGEWGITTDIDNENGKKEGTTYVWLEETPASEFEF